MVATNKHISKKSTASNSIDTNLAVDVGFGWVKIASKDSDGNFIPIRFPNVIAIIPAEVPAPLSPNTVKVIVKSSTRSDILCDESRLVGEKANLYQGAGKHSAYKFKKADKDIVFWTILASYSYSIPEGTKTININNPWLGVLLQDITEQSALKKALVGKHVFELERLLKGVIQKVTVTLTLTEERIIALQEASCAIHYVREHNLSEIPDEQGIHFGNVSIGVGTVDFILQDADGVIIQSVSRDDLGISSLASLITSQLIASGRVNNPTVDRILQAIGETGTGTRFLYGRGSSGVDISDIFQSSLKTWKKNIMSEYINTWKDEFNWIERTFFYGGGVHHLKLEQVPKQIFFFPKHHDPQFVDVWGAKIWMEHQS